jgi:hypothetical protein
VSAADRLELAAQAKRLALLWPALPGVGARFHSVPTSRDLARARS